MAMTFGLGAEIYSPTGLFHYIIDASSLYAQKNRVDVEKGLGPSSERPRSRERHSDNGRQMSSSSTGRGARGGSIVDPDYFFVPPQPVKFPASFRMYSETEGRKGIRKNRGKKKAAAGL